MAIRDVKIGRRTVQVRARNDRTAEQAIRHLKDLTVWAEMDGEEPWHLADAMAEVEAVTGAEIEPLTR